MARKPSERKPRLKNQEEEVSNIIQHRTVSNRTELLQSIRINLKCKSENQKKLVNNIKDKEVIVCSGLPGTGKTYLTCVAAIELLKSNPNYEKIVLVKSVTTLKSEELGFIKGSVQDKLEGIMYSFMNNFEKIIGKFNLEKLKELEMIQIIPIAFMRGINIDNAIIIVDEVQNISIDNIRTILTRLGTNSKMILLGDVNQIDIKNKRDSSLVFLLDKLKHINEIGVVELGIDDVVRNPLIKVIEPIFNERNTPIKYIKQHSKIGLTWYQKLGSYLINLK